MHNEDFGKLLMVAKAVGGGGGGGPTVTVEPLSVSENGTYQAPAGKAYSPVAVDVPQVEVEELTASENGDYTPETGKAFGPVHVAVPQIEVEPLSVTENGTFNAPEGTAYDEVVVNVHSSGGGSGSYTDDVVFIDYDGSIIKTYSAEEFLELEELPENPSHSGLTAQGWNWTLAEAKTQVQACGAVAIGQLYIPSDGEDVCVIDITLQDGRTDPHIGLVVPTGKTIAIDWGDGSATDSFVGASAEIDAQHSYQAGGDYTIKISITGPTAAGNVVISGDSTNGSHLIWGGPSATAGLNQLYQNAITGVARGSNFSLGAYAFSKCRSLETATMPLYGGNLSFAERAFWLCLSLKGIVLPGTSYLKPYMFNSCYSMKGVSLPARLSEVGDSAFGSCSSLAALVIPDGVNTVGTSGFGSTNAMKRLVLPRSLTSVGNNGITSILLLESIVIPSINTMGTSLFSALINLTSLEMLEGTETIPTNCLTTLSSLVSLEIPASVTRIEGTALSNLWGLKTLKFLSATPPTFAASTVLANLPTDCKILVPAGSLSAYTSATNYPSSSTYTYEEY